MKKNSLILVFVVVFALMATACTPQGTAFLAEAQKVNAWKYQEMKSDMKLTATVPGPTPVEDGKAETAMQENLDMSVKVEGYVNQEDANRPKAQITMTIEDNLGVVNMNGSFQMLMDGKTVYVSKNYFDAMMGKGEVSAEAKALREAYDVAKWVVINGDEAGEDAAKIKAYQDLFAKAGTEEQIEQLKKLSGLLDFALPLKQDGRSFSYVYDGKALSAQVRKSLTALEKNLPAIWDTLHLNELAEIAGEGAFPAQDVVELQKVLRDTMQEESFQKSMADLDEWLKDASLKGSYAFSDDRMKEDIQMHLPIADLMTFSLENHQQTTKATKRHIEIPAQQDTISFEDVTKLSQMLNPNVTDSVVVDLREGYLVEINGNVVALNLQEKDGKILLPYRALFEGMGLEVSYVHEGRQACVTLGGVNVCESFYIDVDRAYLSLDEIKALGFVVEPVMDEGEQMYTISLPGAHD